MSLTPNDVLQFAAAERRLDKRIDDVESRLSNWKVDFHVDGKWSVNIPEPPAPKAWPGVFAMLALALSIVAVCVAVFA